LDHRRARCGPSQAYRGMRDQALALPINYQ
jgi:hypothetical protein